MITVIEILAGIAILANAVVYGTDVFGAIVLRPAVAAVDDRALTQSLGHIHRIADRRFSVIGAVGLVAALATAAVAAASGRWVSAAAAAVATLALIGFLVVYTRISKPVNAVLSAAAVAGEVPVDVRRLQTRWESVIDVRVAVQAIALIALCVALVAA
ncbi:DUF1772 domain-containing protein [Mycolicibacterium celeriflavum]|uniref:DUF1772 domain-containing protein n=1 Tax=Mycolicibacterium celeriflavum TaxID=1249101 RepID=UPI003CF90E7A